VAVALLVAAGRGTRLGSSGPKALVAVAGRPMLEWSLDALRAVEEIEAIVVALPEGLATPAGTVGVPGGAERSHSVLAALRASEGDPVVVHDAARPLVTPEIVRATLAALHEHGCDAAIAAAPVHDTVKRAVEGVVHGTLDRSELWAVQTPQVFRRGGRPGDGHRRRVARRGAGRRRAGRAVAAGELQGHHAARPPCRGPPA
jgi:2-C-methyl-D-erythritol 4-phosphate cytidylyltransferase